MGYVHPSPWDLFRLGYFWNLTKKPPLFRRSHILFLFLSAMAPGIWSYFRRIISTMALRRNPYIYIWWHVCTFFDDIIILYTWTCVSFPYIGPLKLGCREGVPGGIVSRGRLASEIIWVTWYLIGWYNHISIHTYILCLGAWTDDFITSNFLSSITALYR